MEKTSMKDCGNTFLNGLIKENPTFVLMLGMCPTLAVTSSAINGFGMGMTTTVVLTMSNIIISLLRKVIPDKVRINLAYLENINFLTDLKLIFSTVFRTNYFITGVHNARF